MLNAANDLLNGQWFGLMPLGVGRIGQHLFVLRLLDRVGVIDIDREYE